MRFRCLGHPVVQHHLEHGTADAECASLVRPVRAGGDRRAGARQDRGLQAQGDLGRRPVPLGYRSVGKKLEIAPEEADLVRKIFADYLRLGSISALAASFNAEGLKPKPRQLANGQTAPGACYRVGPLAHL